MPRKKTLALVIITLALISLACASIQIGIITPTVNDSPSPPTLQPEVDTTKPSESEKHTPEAYPAPKNQISNMPEKTEAYPAPEIMQTSTSVPTMPVFSSIDLPAPLYISNHGYSNTKVQAAWRLDPGAYQARMITPIDTTAFDVWPQDGRIAYANNAGELYVTMPGKEAQLVYQAGEWMDRDLCINSLAWSPDGTRLAYSITFSPAHESVFEDPVLAAQPTGVWILTLDEQSHDQLLRNIYSEPQHRNINEIRSVTKMNWSPDGEALLLHSSHFEWEDVYWLYPLVFSEDEANLHDPEKTGWMNAAWSRDSQTVLLSGMSYSSWSELIRVDRNSMTEEVLVASGFPDQGVYTSNAQELANGITFFMSPSDSNGETSTRLYLGNENTEGFSYVRVGPDRDLCEFASSNIAWDASESLVVVTCGVDTVQLISIDGSIDIDLTPYFISLLDEVNNTYDLEIFWEAPNESIYTNSTGGI